MRFNVSSTTLCNRLLTLQKIISGKNSIAILDSILFELNDGVLKMTASDSDATLITTLEVNDSDGNGCFAINASKIINGLKEIAEQPINILVDDNNYSVEINYMNGKSNFVGQDGAEYPLPNGIGDNTKAITIGADALLGGISTALFATANDELRPMMNGIYFDINQECLTFVASDGHKLVRNRNYSVNGNEPAAFILPKKPANILKGILPKESGEAVIRFDERSAEIQLEAYTLTCRLIEGRYPNYNSVIPNDNPFRVTINRLALIGALRRVLVFASTSTLLVKLQVSNNSLNISAQDVDFSTAAQENIICDYSGNSMSIGFKGPFLVDILNTITSEDVVLELADPSRAGVIVPAEQGENEEVLMLLMPMMLND